MALDSKDLPFSLAPEVIAARRPRLTPGEDYWVYGYGSLMWQPGFPHLEVRTGRLEGYHRRFCVYSHRYRGTPDCPGLVLGLDAGGLCDGLVFRVPAQAGEEVMDYLFEREMVSGVYLPMWLETETPMGEVTALSFVVDPTHGQYAGRLSEDEVVRLIAQGRGVNGPCCDYLENTVRHLHALGLKDAYLSQTLDAVRTSAQSTPQ